MATTTANPIMQLTSNTLPLKLSTAPRGIETDKNGVIYVTDASSINVITPLIAVNNSGNIWDTANQKNIPITYITYVAGIRIYIGVDGGNVIMMAPSGIAQTYQGDISIFSDVVYTNTYNNASGTYILCLTTPMGYINGAWAVSNIQVVGIIYINETIYVGLDKIYSRVVCISKSGVVKYLSGTSIGDLMPQIYGSYPSPSTTTGKVYVYNASTTPVPYVAPLGTSVWRIVPLVSNLNNPSGIAMLPNNTLVVAETGNKLIKSVTLTGTTALIAGQGAPIGSFNTPTGVATGADGAIYVSDAGGGVYKISNGSVATLGSAVALGVAVGADNSVYAIVGQQVVKFSGGAQSVLAGGSQAGYQDGASALFSNPSGIAFGGDGALYIGDTGNSKIRSVDTTTGKTATAGSGVTPYDIAFSPDGGTMYITDTTTKTISTLPITTTTLPTTTLPTTTLPTTTQPTTTQPTTTTQTKPPTPPLVPLTMSTAIVTTFATGFSGPNAVAVDTAGNLYIADTFNHCIRKVSASGSVTTLAGSYGSAGSANGTGTTAKFNTPYGLALGTSGNVYVADSYNNSIRMVTQDGVVTTLAGSGGAGNADGTGAAAGFSGPNAVAVDAAGNVYVADTYNNSIRKITPSGAVTTLVSTGLNNPKGIAVDSSGNIYIGDTGSCAIKKIPFGGSMFTLAGSGNKTWGDGTGTAASFAWPVNIAVDSAGNVYVADNSNHSVRMVSPSGVVTTLAGQWWGWQWGGIGYGWQDGVASSALFQYTNGVAVDMVGNVYVVESKNNAVRKISAIIVSTPTAAQTTTLPPPTPMGSIFTYNNMKVIATTDIPYGTTITSSQYIQYPRQFLIDVNANIMALMSTAYIKSISDALPSLARSVNFGYNNTMVPLGLTTLAAPTWVAITSTGSLYISDTGNNRVCVYDGANQTYKAVPTGYDTPTGIAIGASSVYLATRTAVLKLSSTFTLVSATTGFLNPQGIVLDGGGNVIVADTGNNRICKIPASGPLVVLCSVPKPQGVSVNSSGVVYFTNNHAVSQINSDGSVSIIAGSTQGFHDNSNLNDVAQFNGPTGIFLDASNNIFVADTGNNRIRVIDQFSRSLTLAGSGVSGTNGGTPLTTAIPGPIGIVMDASKNMFIVGSGPVQKLSLTYTNIMQDISSIKAALVTTTTMPLTTTTTTLPLTTTTTTRPLTTTTTTLPLTTTTTTTTTLPPFVPLKMATAVVSTFAGQLTGGSANGQGVSASFSTPYGLEIDAAGNIYVAEYINNRIRKISSTGAVTTLAGSGTAAWVDGQGVAASFNGPTDVALDSAGNVYVAEYGNHRIRKVSADGLVTTLAGSGSQAFANGQGSAASFNSPAGVATDASGNVYVADSGNNAIRMITPTGLVSTLVSTGLNSPRGVIVDASGNIYIINGGGHTILKIPSGGSMFVLAGSGSPTFADGQGTAASFQWPIGGVLDKLGNLYVGDNNNHRIRMVSPSGLVTTLAGSESGSANGSASLATFKNPCGIIMDPTGSIYVADSGNNMIRKISA